MSSPSKRLSPTLSPAHSGHQGLSSTLRPACPRRPGPFSMLRPARHAAAAAALCMCPHACAQTATLPPTLPPACQHVCVQAAPLPPSRAASQPAHTPHCLLHYPLFAQTLTTPEVPDQSAGSCDTSVTISGLSFPVVHLPLHSPALCPWLGSATKVLSKHCFALIDFCNLFLWPRCFAGVNVLKSILAIDFCNRRALKASC
mmetsp:Transcript_25860/g.76608  ORF Transcript_25860/g.76608 Transcript_25860/m.76608 type:complete len:201 (+) Transcript_25860:314-916(+)